MLELCLFDLDETLLETEDLEEIRLSGVRNNTKEYRQRLTGNLGNQERIRYSEQEILSIRQKIPNVKLGIFSRSPRSYVETLLSWAYPNIKWDIIVAYEDVRRTKPYGEGIRQAMDRLGIKYLNHVAMIGDSDVDIRAAYNAGVIAILDKGAWPYRYAAQHWNAVSLVPDAIIEKPSQLASALTSIATELPDLESRLYQANPSSRRFDKTNFFIPNTVDQSNKAYPIHYLGRHFSNYECLNERAKWHELTSSIHSHKEAQSFPGEWIESIVSFISYHYPTLCFAGNLIVTVVPARPGRTHRLANLLKQVESRLTNPLLAGRTVFLPELLAYRDGVLSNSREHLSREDRFKNIRDHLYINQPEKLKDRQDILIIDDVATSGSTLIYPKIILEKDSRRVVTCLSIAKNISKVV